MSYIFDPRTHDPAANQRRGDMARALMMQAGQSRKIEHPLEGAAQMAQALMFGRMARKSEERDAKGRGEANDMFTRALFGGNEQAPSFAPSSKPMSAPGDIQGIIHDASGRYGLDPQTMMTIAALESNFDPGAKNPNSSASGLYQFIDSTAGQYGLSDPMDPVASSDAAARLARDNSQALARTLGREPNGAELYLAHQQGAGGASRLLANPNARAADIVGLDAVRLNGGSPDMTAGEFANLWMTKFNSRAGVSPQPIPRVNRQQELAQALGNPYMEGWQRQMLVQHLMGSNESKPTDDMREYEYARSQGFQGSFTDFMTEMRRAGASNVTVGGKYGSIPQGYMLQESPDGVSMVPIPGGPEDTSAKDAARAESERTSASIVLDEIDIAKTLIESNPKMTTGIVGGFLANVDQTLAGAVKNRLETIKANIGFDKLQDMRDNSPTGGALGQVSEFENRLLQAVYGSLVQSQDSNDLIYNLTRLQDIYNRIVHEGIPDEEARQLYRENALRGFGNEGGQSTKNPDIDAILEMYPE